MFLRAENAEATLHPNPLRGFTNDDHLQRTSTWTTAVAIGLGWGAGPAERPVSPDHLITYSSN